MVAHLPSKQMVAGSSPVSRSTSAVFWDGGHMVAVLHGLFPTKRLHAPLSVLLLGTAKRCPSDHTGLVSFCLLFVVSVSH